MSMLTEPITISAANYKLLPAGQFHRTRKGKVKALVVHVTAGLQDLGLVGTDESAEGTNKWALSSGVVASWCRIADTDGVESCLPSTFVAYQAKGYNTHTVGNEIANRDARWDNKPDAWVKWTIWFAALSYADLVVKYRIPLRRATKAELDHAIATDGAPVGFVDHSRLSVNRSDPGATFPWALFFKYLQAIIAGASHPDRLTTPTPTTQEDDEMPITVKHPRTGKQVPVEEALWSMWTYTLELRGTAGSAARDAAVARALAEASASEGRALTEAEIDAIGKRVGAELAAGFDIELNPKETQS